PPLDEPRPPRRARRLPLPGRPLPAAHVVEPGGDRSAGRPTGRECSVTTANGPKDVPGDKPGRKKLTIAPLQKFGRALMLPIAVLPAAGLLVRLGQPDILGEARLGSTKVAAVVGAAGDALLTQYLPLLFAIGIAIGLARKADGSTALAAAVGWVVYKAVGDAMSPFVLGTAPEGGEAPLIDYGVVGGIIMGLVTAF